MPLRIHRLDASPEPVNLARLALKRLGLVGKGVEHDWRPTREELERLAKYLDGNPRLHDPHDPRRSVCRGDRDAPGRDLPGRMARSRPVEADAPHPGSQVPWNKSGNDQRIPLFCASGFDAWGLSAAPRAAFLRRTRGTDIPLQLEICLERRFAGRAAGSGSRTFISMICAMKERAACSRQALRSSRSP